jgi:uncharacterized RDD family membrane protein YckC
MADRPPAAARATPRAQVVATRVHGGPARPRLEYQGLVTRGVAFALDAAVVNVVAVVVAAAAGLIISALSLPDGLNKALVAVGTWLFLVWSTAYFVTFWCSTGQTPGNRVMQIRVVRAKDGATLRPFRALLRLIGIVLAALPLFLGFLPILLNERRRGLQDVMGGTVVVGVAEKGPPGLERDHPKPQAEGRREPGS